MFNCMIGYERNNCFMLYVDSDGLYFLVKCNFEILKIWIN